MALGLEEWAGDRRRLALAAVLVGSLVLALGTIGYGMQVFDKL